MLARLLLALAWPVLGAAAPVERTVAAPAALEIPALGPSAVPSLDAAAAPAAGLAPAAAVAPPGAPDAPHAAADLQRLAGAAVEPPAGGVSAAQAGHAFFDAARPSDGAALSEPLATGTQPTIALPAGVVRAESHTIRTAEDVDRWIPDGSNSRYLIARLKEHLAQMAPYRVYRYHDSKGGFFTAIDLSQNPRLIEILPEQKSHEVKLIKKLQLYNTDLQVVVREELKTPDIVLGGRITELKSLIGRNVDFTFLVNKANTQVSEHAARHRLGPGAAAVDLTSETSVDVGRLKRELDAWAAGKAAKRQPVALERVYVFAGLELKVFHRQPDGRYAAQAKSQLPLGRAPGRVDNKDVHTIQLLLKKDRVKAAHRQFDRLERQAPHQPPGSPLRQARERLRARRFLEALRKLARKRRYASALALWDNFKTTQDAALVHELERDVAALLPAAKVPELIAPLPEDEALRLRRELEEPRAALAAAGVKATVTVYGSARILPRAEARRRYEQTRARVGDAPDSDADRQALAQARQAVALSRYYEEARQLGGLIARLGGGSIGVATGGGPSIMEAANRGAFEAGGPSIGHNIELPQEQKPNAYQTKGLSFRYSSFSTRKANLRHGAVAHVYFPGGFGTMDELFELLTLMQTGKTPRAPIILVGERDYWNQVLDFKKFAQLGLISERDLGLFHYAENADEAWFVIGEALRAPSAAPARRR